MKLIVYAVLGLLSARCSFSQQVGVVDLTRLESTQAPQRDGGPLPEGCTRTSGAMVNGDMKLDDNQPRAILLEIVKLSSEVFEVGGDGQAEIRLRNVGEKAIVIPWSTDPSVIQKAPNPDHLQWEQGNFGIVLRDKQSHTIPLKNAEWSLYGSEFVSASQLTIKPGEWVTAFLGFKVEDLYHTTSFTQFPVGESKLFLQWEQALRKWDRGKCGWSTAWFDYEDYYKQDHPAISVQITRSGSDATKIAK